MNSPPRKKYLSSSNSRVKKDENYSMLIGRPQNPILGSSTEPDLPPIWLLPPWLLSVLKLVEINIIFFEGSIPIDIPIFINQIPTHDPVLLPNLIDVIVAIVAAMQTAPSKAQEALPWHLFLWLPHLILAEKDRNSSKEESAKLIKKNLHLFLFF